MPLSSVCMRCLSSLPLHALGTISKPKLCTAVLVVLYSSVGGNARHKHLHHHENFHTIVLLTSQTV